MLQAVPEIVITGARQNNLKNLDLNLPLGEFIVVTGLSGSGKSSLAFDTIYAEGQRRYVETFSPYARQFLDRMDKPQVDGIEGIPPAIAIDQTNPVRTSRSTVGTMTELNDHLKLLFARAARLFCNGCGREVRRDTPEGIAEALLGGPEAGRQALITFPVTVPHNFTVEEIRELLARQGYRRLHREEEDFLEVVQDRLRLDGDKRQRLVEDLEAALRVGQGRVTVYALDSEKKTGEPRYFSADLHCPDCDLHFHDPVPSFFSFNSPLGACETCRGFGRVIGVDDSLVIPDESKSLAEGAVKPWQTESYRECQNDLIRFATQRGIPVDIPWAELSEEQRRWVFEGEGSWQDDKWYGVRRFFEWLESRAYKMHIRVLLSRYRSYDACPDCEGARLKEEALLWRLGTRTGADRVLEPARRHRPVGSGFDDETLAALPGLSLHDVMLLPLRKCKTFFERLQLPAPLDEAVEQVLGGIRSRLEYLVEVGVGYLNLDRQSRTLSGGEVQRINLTTALGTSLVGTLFVLDEPSIGLHPRDLGRIVGVLQRLRDAGNTLVVVEHDPQVMLAADRVLDLGPGPGERGGQVMFNGSPAELLTSEVSLTAGYLSGRLSVLTEATAAMPPTDADARLEILGAAENNLRGIDVAIPLGRLVCMTGVSGSGKSTLVQQVGYNALCKIKGKPVDTPGVHREIRGAELIDDVVMVDQSPIGRTARSNPASYVGAFDAIRKRFASEPLALARGYTAGTFSFNSGTGRCPTCKGSGFEHVEMQFLSDVYLRCPDCDGSRYRPETLEVQVWPAGDGEPCSVADVLGMTVTQAGVFFSDNPEVIRTLEPLEAVGLGYLKLGQPVPTLSGGEAQRLKLAGHLARAKGRRRMKRGSLFLFDEPTTGLHFDDISRLLGAFRRLIAEGHSLVVIEHNLDVIRASDWIIDLGPEGGEEGGDLVCVGTPEEVAEHPGSHTGAALCAYMTNRPLIDSVGAGPRACPGDKATPGAILPQDTIEIVHAREHNLKNIDISIPRRGFTVITGISGSGKSTVAFDILFAEGQRRYLESLNAYARQFVQPASRPEVDAIFGIPPTVAIEQRTSRGGRKSTVATLTEVYHFLRLLFVKLGTPHCPECDLPIEPQSVETIQARLFRDLRSSRVSLLAPLVVARKGFYTDLAKWAAGKGFSHLRVDGIDTPTDSWPRLDRYREHDIDLPVASLRVRPEDEDALRSGLRQALAFGKGAVKVVVEGEEGERIFSSERACPGCGRSFVELDPRLFSFNSKHGWCPTCFGTGAILPGFDSEQSGEESAWSGSGGVLSDCPDCRGRRLRPEALAVRFRDLSIADYTALPVTEARRLFSEMHLAGREEQIARDILSELCSRLAFLAEVGLGYLSLDRAAPTLSGGEAQRIRLAAQLGSNLRGVCYILDEPTIGLHPRDNRLLLDTLGRLEAKGNTVVVVEHDDETIRRADHVIDLGPGAGEDGGWLVAAGTAGELMAHPESVTGRFLARPLRHPLIERRSGQGEAGLRIIGADRNNLRRIDAELPLGRLVCVTGVSGSGKSTLVRDVLYGNLRRLLAKGGDPAATDFHGCSRIEGWEGIERVLEVDQTPIGKTPRSCPATYVGFWDDIRRLFAGTPEAKMRGYGPARFSFNVAEGRCQECAGQGLKKVEMNFLPDVRVPCEVCGGRRFSAETRMVRYKGQSIDEVLAMSVDEAAGFFAAHGKIGHALQVLQDVGLGYLTLGQPSPTLSGGEAQRLKLVTELARVRVRDSTLRSPVTGDSSLYILDEPTIGLHMADVERLIRVLHKLVEAGNTVVVIEHNLDIIAEADWLVDLGPEGGDSGGRIVVAGTPEQAARTRRKSHTAKVLKTFLAERAPDGSG
ncbi:MAG: excinuclease ABC subunit UvrA [Desulfuromonadales bacterium]